MREMKDSGIEWIGKIPSDWKVNKLKFSSKNREEKIANNTGSDYFALENVLGWNGTLIETENEYDTTGAICCKKGDVAFGKLRPYLAKVFHVDYDRCCSSEFAVFYDFNGVSRYYFYIMLTKGFVNAVDISTYGVKMPRANVDFIKNMVIPIPPISEQQAIVEYLDKQCEELNNLISDLHHQIEALEEYKCSVITEAVTKGLDPDVEMRDSGIAWVGDVPAHWITHPLYFYFGERKNKNALGLETNLLSLSYGKIIRKDINSNGGLLPESFNTYNIIEKDDIIIRPTDLQNDKRSLRTGIAREHGIITSAYIAMKAIKSVNPEYFHYLLHAYDVMKVFYNMGNGVRQGLSFSEFSRLMVFEPTIEEQNAIVAYLKEKCDEIDLAIAEKKQQIETIEEYKKSLIFEYVTGKKEVER